MILQIWRILVMILFLLVFPVISGRTITKKDFGILAEWCLGLLYMAGLFEVCCVPLAILHRPLHEVLILWILIWSILTLVLFFRQGGRQSLKEKAGIGLKEFAASVKEDRVCILLLLCILGLLAWECSVYALRTHIDDDDARYVANAVAACETDTVYQYHPDTGEKLTYFAGELCKDLVSCIMIFYAGISFLMRIHPTILIHSLWPVVWLLTGSVFLWLIARSLYEKNSRRLYFVLVCMLVRQMGGVTVYTGSSFTLLRLWQGKAVVPAVVVPMGIWLLLEEKNGRKEFWQGILLMNVFACLCSGNGIYLSGIMTGILCLFRAVRNRSWQAILYGAACLVPNALCVLVYELAGKLVIR